MRTAEVEVNARFTFYANDKELHAFKLACVKNRTEQAPVLRAAMRAYVAQNKRGVKGPEAAGDE